ncbi:MAG: aldehyde dehydrogenase PuuC [Gammaproteobacteria bacterium]|nr:MAG: aldehyde dehydrogenase PuuC [Gammaproteobacteria bacterium]
MHISEAQNVTKEEWQTRAAALKPETRLFIGGEFVAPMKGQSFETVNPATGEVIAEMARGTEADVDRAVASALQAYKTGIWSRKAPRDRMAIMSKFASLVEQYGQEFALLDTTDMGKSISEMITVDVPLTALCFQYFSETIDKIEGAVTNTESDAFHYISREPLGVVGAIVPWNYPLMMAAWKIAPALAAGNTVVLKPAEQTPLSALLLARLFVEAGGPPGVFNVVNGFGNDAGRALATHMDVAKISFTGSTEIGKMMMVYAGQSNMKKVSTECGGKSPQIILADVADLDTAVEYAVNGIYGNQGEVCNAGSRILVEDKIYDEFLDKFVVQTHNSFTPGDPLDPKTTMGPLVNEKQQARVLGYIDSGNHEGATLNFGGDVPEGFENGCYVSPTLFSDVSSKMKIAKEEIFGPVASVMRISSAAEAIAIANDSPYGLAAGIWTSDLITAHQMARDIESGIVWVNCFDHGDMTQPFGGFKQSGQGRDKCFDTVLQHTQTKSVWMHLG